MYIQNVQCSNPSCRHIHGVDGIQLARQASRWACPLCATVTDYADEQVARPDVSPQAKDVWRFIGFAATFIGVVLAVQIIDQKIAQLIRA